MWDVGSREREEKRGKKKRGGGMEGKDGVKGVMKGREGRVKEACASPLSILLYTTVHYMLTIHPSFVVCDVRVLKVEASAKLTVREKERLFVWLLW